jgi:MFS family permease
MQPAAPDDPPPPGNRGTGDASAPGPGPAGIAPPAAPAEPGLLDATATRRALVALVSGQICLHSAMAGLRLAAPLMLLREGGMGVAPELAAGLLLGLFALAPVVTALPSGRWVDRRGYHRPVRLAVALVVLGALFALPSAWLQGPARALLLALAAIPTGIGANLGLIAIQRSAGRLVPDADAHGIDATERNLRLKRVFSWLGLAPSLANMIGPVLAGTLIDAGGFGLAFAGVALLPLGTLVLAGRVPEDWVRPAPARPGGHRSHWRTVRDVLALPGMGVLIAVNWLFSSSWDLHAYAVPLLGHERALSASAIGGVLGVFAGAVAAARLAMPWIAGHLPERRVFIGALCVVATVFLLYPLSRNPLEMMACAALLGLALGVVQPLVMTTLHHLAPAHRQGEAIAVRSMSINLSAALLPLGFGALGASLGASGLFRAMVVILLIGLWLPRRLPTPG